MKKKKDNFRSVTIFVLATNETDLLRETIKKIRENVSDEDIDRVIVVAKSCNCPGFFEANKIILESNWDKLSVYVQRADTVELCLAELPHLAESSHFIIMVADMEMDPENLRCFVDGAKKNPEKIICAAKWVKGSTVEGYGRLHEIGSRAVNLFISVIFNKKVRDPFSIYQIYPVSVYKRMNFRKDSEFVYEYTIKPLHNDVEYEEIPTAYKKRSAGKSNFKFGKLVQTAVSFMLAAVRIRLSPKERHKDTDVT